MIAALSAGALLLSGGFFVNRHFQRLGKSTPSTEVKAAPVVADPVPIRPTNPPLPSVAHLSQENASANFVLQVGAMIRQENALALADSLRKGNFPVLVSREVDDRFYRVLVGPFSDEVLDAQCWGATEATRHLCLLRAVESYC